MAGINDGFVTMSSLAQPNLSVIIVGAVPPPYHGQTIFTEALLRSKIAQRFDVYHLDTSDRRDLDNIGRFEFRNLYLGLKNLIDLAYRCLLLKPAIVYVPISQNTWGFLRDGLFVLLARVFSRAAVVIHYHGGDTFVDFRKNAGTVMKFFIRFVLARVNTAIVVGESLRGVFGADVKRVVAVHNGITFTPNLEAYQRRNGQFLRISFLSNLVESKGILDFIGAARIVLRQYSNLQFHIAGAWWNQEPMTRRRVEELIWSAHADGRIHFHGPLSGMEKVKFFSDTDIFVFPTWSDSFGLVNLEAMAAGCPVISTKVGAIPEVVLDGVTGILVEKQNPQQLAEAIMRLIDDPALRQRMGEAGRKRFEEHYTFDKCAERLIEVFEQVLAQRVAS